MDSLCNHVLLLRFNIVSGQFSGLLDIYSVLVLSNSVTKRQTQDKMFARAKARRITMIGREAHSAYYVGNQVVLKEERV